LLTGDYPDLISVQLLLAAVAKVSDNQYVIEARSGLIA
jgi:hypothetical protein